MQEALMQLYGHALGVWRHRWIALAVTWVVALAGWAYVWQMPEAYVANARVFVDTNSVLRPLMKGLAVTPNIDQRIGMMSRTLLSRPNLETLARMTDLDLSVTNDAQKEGLLKRLENSIQLSGVRGNASLYAIEVTDPDRDTARRIAQSLITIFIENSLSEKREDSSGAKSFLDQQIAESERRLIEAENRLAVFKQRNVDVLPGEQGDYYSRLQQARGALEQARLELREQENRRADLIRQLEGEEPVFLSGSVGGASQTPIDARIQALQVQLDSLLTRYTERHPEVRQLRGLIDELESERDESYGGSSFGGNAGALASSPVYQGMRSMLAEADAGVAELKVRVNEYESRVEALAGKVNAIPEVEAQLKQLTRDYDVLSRQHQEMLERRESARLGSDVENTAGNVTFRVIDPPYVPLQPSYPDKVLLNVGVFVLAAGAGVALALVLSLIRPVVNDARVLAYSTGLPLLGSVTYNKSREERKSDGLRFAMFSACVLCLVMAFASVVVVPSVMAG